MKKLFLGFLFLSLNLISQNDYGLATYKIILTEKKKLKKPNPKFEERIRIMELEGKKIRPKLKFNNSKSIFYMEGLMTMEAESASIIYCNCDLPIYTDLVANKTYKESQAGVITDAGEFVVEREIFKNWQILDETKYVDKYKCIKATQTIYNEEGTQQLVTAWFCPEIPYSFGPSGFAGLPGLIIELQIGTVVFGLESLKFINKKTDVKIPSKGKKISFDDYYKVSKTRLNEFKEQMKKTAK